jgi:cytochrome P450
LARNPECQEKLLQEVNQVTGGDIVEEKHLPQLSYLKGVIKEALRYSLQNYNNFKFYIF